MNPKVTDLLTAFQLLNLDGQVDFLVGALAVHFADTVQHTPPHVELRLLYMAALVTMDNLQQDRATELSEKVLQKAASK